MKSTENMIQQTLAKKFFNDFFVCNKFYSDFEADFLRVTSAGFLYEYEIKVSLADFRNDFNKCCGNYRTEKYEKKHDLLRDGTLHIKNFFFCAPAGIIPVEEVPEEFGLIEFRREEDSQQLFMTIVQKPKSLSDHKVDRKFKLRFMEKTYWDYKHRMCEKAKGEWIK